MGVRLVALASASVTLFAGTVVEIWNEDYPAWTEKDARQIVTRSPWAKELPMPISQRDGVVYFDPNVNASSPPTAVLGNPANTTTGANMSTAGAGDSGPAERNGALPTTRTPSLVSAPTGAPPSQPTLKVIWASAWPVRLAVLKLRSGNNPPTAAQIAAVEKDWPKYVIAVVGLPAPKPSSDVKALAEDASLSIRGKPPLRAAGCDYRRIGDSDVYFFQFLKAELPLTIADGEVEFKLASGRMDLKQKFHLVAMQCRGRLAL